MQKHGFQSCFLLFFFLFSMFQLTNDSFVKQGGWEWKTTQNSSDHLITLITSLIFHFVCELYNYGINLEWKTQKNKKNHAMQTLWKLERDMPLPIYTIPIKSMVNEKDNLFFKSINCIAIGDTITMYCR